MIVEECLFPCFGLLQEHEELFEKQHRANDEWLMARRVENDRERQDIANTKVELCCFPSVSLAFGSRYFLGEVYEGVGE